MLYTSNALDLMAFYFFETLLLFCILCFSNLHVCLLYVCSACGCLKRPSDLLNWAMWALGTELRSSKEQPVLLPTVVYCETADVDAHRTSHRAQMDKMDQQVP